jgi:phosphoribosylformimino-5-aminoimidazole carboxamide ribotide isomerase
VPFDLLGVVDLRGGRAVHAFRGERARYAPIETLAGDAIAAGDPSAVVRYYVDRLGIRQLYVADLDAIVDDAPQDAAVRALVALGTPIWLDAASRSTHDAQMALDRGAARVVIGLETLSSLEALNSMCAGVGGNRIAFSLDLRDGQPIAPASSLEGLTAEALTARAAQAGVCAVIVLDLARVGTGAGLDFDLLRGLHRAAGGVAVLAGGGVRGFDDLLRLRDAGCSGALVATALLEGRIRAAEIEALSGLSHADSATNRANT